MIDFNKIALEITYNAMSLVSDKNEEMVDTMLEQTTWMPEEGKKNLEGLDVSLSFGLHRI